LQEATCSAEGCERAANRKRAGGVCEPHYRANLAKHREYVQCIEDGCTRKGDRTQRCTTHYSRYRRANQPLRPCSVEGCSRPLQANGVCGMHHQRLRTTGTTHRDPEPPPVPPIVLFRCKQCGVEFTRERAEVRKAIKDGRAGPFCSRACSNGHRAVPADPQPAPRVNIETAALITEETVRTETNRRKYYSENLEPTTWCAGCGVWIGRGPGRTCRSCYMAARASTYVTCTCTTCGVEFQLMRAEDSKKERAGQVNRYCSPTCLATALRTGSPCKTCGKAMAKPNGRKFCSEECRRPSRTRMRKRNGHRVLDPRVCSTCSKAFRPKSSRRQYCSRECASDAHSARMVGAGNSHFKDGTSYAEWFKQMRALIIDRDVGCRACGEIKPPKEVWRRDRDKPQIRSQMVVHHIDERPWRNEPENLIYLCQRCHLLHHKSTVTPFPWFEGYAFDASLDMPDEWHEAVSALAEKYAAAADQVFA
jgi:predicted nucleic acid-binding Zn ribbon protein